jgi:hypothetical protein
MTTQLPFDPASYSGEWRIEMEYDHPYEADGTGQCSHDNADGPATTLTKHHAANRPLGRLYWRCEKHSAAKGWR